MRRRSWWGSIAAPIIHQILKETADPDERRRRLRAAYPFGERCCYPYRRWLSEIHAQWRGFRRRRPEPEELVLTSGEEDAQDRVK